MLAEFQPALLAQNWLAIGSTATPGDQSRCGHGRPFRRCKAASPPHQNTLPSRDPPRNAAPRLLRRRLQSIPVRARRKRQPRPPSHTTPSPDITAHHPPHHPPSPDPALSAPPPSSSSRSLPLLPVSRPSFLSPCRPTYQIMLNRPSPWLPSPNTFCPACCTTGV